jgi:uncharacterized membrane protein
MTIVSLMRDASLGARTSVDGRQAARPASGAVVCGTDTARAVIVLGVISCSVLPGPSVATAAASAVASAVAAMAQVHEGHGADKHDPQPVG